jgi:alkylhydroperoxidase/carboxymuconolactone decarboxylase family protein YurZ
MRNLKKLMIIAALAGLLGGSILGCQTLKNAFCSPTAQQVADAANYVANADSVLAFLSTLAPSAEVTAAMAAVKIAKTVFDQIRSGVCVPTDEEQAAQAALGASQVMAMKYGYKP